MTTTVTIHCDNAHEAKVAMAGQTLLACMEDFLEELRSVYKYQETTPTDTVAAAHHWADKMHEILNSRDVSNLLYQ